MAEGLKVLVVPEGARDVALKAGHTLLGRLRGLSRKDWSLDDAGSSFLEASA